MDTRLMELLVCPICKGPLTHDHATQELVCNADRLAFPLRDGIAVMLEGEARSLDDNAPASAPSLG
ncbi:MAG TPA: Trm112 family protein [Burkholderiaceae bacterium]|nr:Trm112 family protein [Burkholderiaceae bacterium]